MQLPPDVVIILHQGAFCLLSCFTGSVHNAPGAFMLNKNLRFLNKKIGFSLDVYTDVCCNKIMEGRNDIESSKAETAKEKRQQS